MLSAPHLIIVFLVALLVFGPEKLPELARTLSKAMGEFHRLSGDFQETIQREMNQMEHDVRGRMVQQNRSEDGAVPDSQGTESAAASSGEEYDPAAEYESAAPEDYSSENEEVAHGEAQAEASEDGTSADSFETHPYGDSYDPYGEMHYDAAMDEPPADEPAPAPPETATGESSEAVQAPSSEESPTPDSPATVNASPQEDSSAAAGVELPLNDHPTAA